MNASPAKGNNPERWEKLLSVLDEKLQFGLLDYLHRVASYHFEDDILYIVPNTKEDEQYFVKPAVFQQLQIFAADAIKVEKIKIKKVETA